MPAVLFYVSGHGFGHATRAIAVLRELRRLRKGLRLLVRTEAPAWLFEEADASARVSRCAVDLGIRQANGLDVDLPATLAAHERLLKSWDGAVEAEAAVIRSSRARLVVGDIPPLAFAAASAAGVPSLAMANFCWDWIFASYAERDARWLPAVRRYGEAYGGAIELLRLPMHGDFPAFHAISDSPLVVSRSRLSRGRARAVVGAADSRPRILFSFGGFGAGALDLSGGDDLSEFVFVGFGPKPRGLKAEWRGFPRKTPVPHVDIVSGCDAIIGKPGYGTFAEAVAHGKPMLYLPREDFPEVPRLLSWMRRWGSSRVLPREDFAAGRWRSALRRLLEGRRGSPAPPDLDGAQFCARRISALVQ